MPPKVLNFSKDGKERNIDHFYCILVLLLCNEEVSCKEATKNNKDHKEDDDLGWVNATNNSNDGCNKNDPVNNISSDHLLFDDSKNSSFDDTVDGSPFQSFVINQLTRFGKQMEEIVKGIEENNRLYTSLEEKVRNLREEVGGISHYVVHPEEDVKVFSENSGTLTFFYLGHKYGSLLI